MPRGGYSSSGDDEALGVLLLLALIGLVIWGIVKLEQLVVSFIAANAGTILTVGFAAMLAVGILGLAVDRPNRAGLSRLLSERRGRVCIER